MVLETISRSKLNIAKNSQFEKVQNSKNHPENAHHLIKNIITSEKQPKSYIEKILDQTNDSFLTETSFNYSISDSTFCDIQQFDVIFPPGPMGLHMEPVFNEETASLGCKIQEFSKSSFSYSGNQILSNLQIGDCVSLINGERVLTLPFEDILEKLKELTSHPRSITFQRDLIEESFFISEKEEESNPPIFSPSRVRELSNQKRDESLVSMNLESALHHSVSLTPTKMEEMREEMDHKKNQTTPGLKRVLNFIQDKVLSPLLSPLSLSPSTTSPVPSAGQVESKFLLLRELEEVWGLLQEIETSQRTFRAEVLELRERAEEVVGQRDVERRAREQLESHILNFEEKEEEEEVGKKAGEEMIRAINELKREKEALKNKVNEMEDYLIRMSKTVGEAVLAQGDRMNAECLMFEGKNEKSQLEVDRLNEKIRQLEGEKEGDQSTILSLQQNVENLLIEKEEKDEKGEEYNQLLRSSHTEIVSSMKAEVDSLRGRVSQISSIHSAYLSSTEDKHKQEVQQMSSFWERRVEQLEEEVDGQEELNKELIERGNKSEEELEIMTSKCQKMTFELESRKEGSEELLGLQRQRDGLLATLTTVRRELMKRKKGERGREMEREHELQNQIQGLEEFKLRQQEEIRVLKEMNGGLSNQVEEVRRERERIDNEKMNLVNEITSSANERELFDHKIRSERGRLDEMLSQTLAEKEELRTCLESRERKCQELEVRLRDYEKGNVSERREKGQLLEGVSSLTSKCSLLTKQSMRAREMIMERDREIGELREHLKISCHELRVLKDHVKEVINESLTTPEKKDLCFNTPPISTHFPQRDDREDKIERLRRNQTHDRRVAAFFKVMCKSLIPDINATSKTLTHQAFHIWKRGISDPILKRENEFWEVSSSEGSDL